MIKIKYPIHLEKFESLPPRSVWHYKSVDWAGFRNYASAFTWNTARFLKSISEASGITEVIQCAVEAYLSYLSYVKLKPTKLFMECYDSNRRD